MDVYRKKSTLKKTCDGIPLIISNELPVELIPSKVTDGKYLSKICVGDGAFRF